jgi:hypothetical protein
MADIFKVLSEHSKLLRTGFGSLSAKMDELIELQTQMVILSGGPITSTTTTTTTLPN